MAWFESRLGGGGYITGLIHHPTAPDCLYARCDVAGVLKTVDGGCHWRAINNGMSAAYHHSVQSIAISPHQPDALLRCSGEARGDRRVGSIHKSIDAGNSWYEVCSEVDYFGNGPTRMHAEVTIFDPHHANKAITGGYSAGCWISEDSGETWHYAGLKGERITSLYCHPLLRDRIYASTASDRVLFLKDQGRRWQHETLAEKMARFHDTPRGQGRLFGSANGGYSWTLLFEGYDFAALAFDGADPEVLYGATLEHGIRKSEDGGVSWRALEHGLPSGTAYNALVATPDEPMWLYTAPDARPQHIHLPTLPLYVSRDRGESWQLVSNITKSDLGHYPAYMWENPRRLGWAISTILAAEQQLFLANWFGVSRSDNGGQTWDGGDFNGIETTCAECITVGPAGRVYFTVADHAPQVSSDGGRTYHSLFAETSFSDSTALVASRHRPGLLLWGMTRRGARPRPCGLIRSEDGGTTGQVVFTSDKELFVQNLVEDFHTPGTFYASLDGALADGAGLYCSRDWGRTWSWWDVSLPAHIKTLPHRQNWIEAEMLPVVGYQVKNVCGTNKLLCVDPHRPDTLYLGEWTEGLFCIMDGGSRLESIGSQLPFGRTEASILSVIAADPDQPDVLYAGFVHEGLWRSRDSGETWTRLYPQDDRPFNASALAIHDGLIAVACEPLFWSPVLSAVVVSRDGGQTWENIYDQRLGALRWKGIAIDPVRHELHGCTCGNGCFVFTEHEGG